jgi:uncharacterized protein (TIGR02118 family)
MIKVTLLYGHPKNPQEFERYYEEKHLPLAARLRGFDRLELTRFEPSLDGRNPAFYRMAELYFSDEGRMQATLDSPEGQAVTGDLSNFATGGVTMIKGTVEKVIH